MKSVLIEHGYNAFLALPLTAHRQLWNQLPTIVCLSRYDLMIFKKMAYFFSKLANHLCSLVPFNVKKKRNENFEKFEYVSHFLNDDESVLIDENMCAENFRADLRTLSCSQKR